MRVITERVAASGHVVDTILHGVATVGDVGVIQEWGESQRALIEHMVEGGAAD